MPPIERLQRISGVKFPDVPTISDNPTVEQAMVAWMQMAQSYATVVARQHEYEKATIAALLEIQVRLDRLGTEA